MENDEDILSSTKYWITTTVSNFSQIIKDLVKEKKDLLVYLYGERDSEGRSWCPDCVLSHPFVENIFPRIMENEPKKELYFVNISVSINQKEIYRNDPIVRMIRIPTLIYFSKGVEMGRIIEKEMATQENIDSFIDQIYEDL